MTHKGFKRVLFVCLFIALLFSVGIPLISLMNQRHKPETPKAPVTWGNTARDLDTTPTTWGQRGLTWGGQTHD